jgi:hypothetical protein
MREGAVESEYRQERVTGGRMRFVVTPATVARESTAPVVLAGVAAIVVLAAVLRAEGVGRAVPAVVGASIAAGLVYGLARRYLTSVLDRLRYPGGTFIVSPNGIELPTGTTIPRDRLERLTVRNGVPAPGGSGLAIPRNPVQRATAERVSHMLCAEHGGRSTTLAGGMTATTASALLQDAGRVLNFR